MLGIAGAISASLRVSPYDNPSVLLPSHLTKYVAILSPNPVFTKPLAKKNEMTINQITSLENAEKAAVNDSVLVRIAAVRPRKAQAPMGRGLRTRPAMVERKMETNCHAWGVSSDGFGMRKQTTRPIESEIMRGMGLAPSGAESERIRDLSCVSSGRERNIAKVLRRWKRSLRAGAAERQMKGRRLGRAAKRKKAVVDGDTRAMIEGKRWNLRW